MVTTENRKKSGEDEKKLGMAFILLVMYFFFEYIRPQYYTLVPIISPIRIPMFVTIGLFIIFLRGEKSLLRDRVIVYVGLFVFLVGFSVVYAPNTYYVWKTFYGLSTILFCVLLVMPAAINNGERFNLFILIWIVINALVALYGLMHGGHGAGGFLWDENDLALALNMCIPLPFYLALSARRSKMQRLFFRLVTVLLVVGSGSTMSRGGFLGIVSVFGMIWLMSERKFRSLAIVLLCVLIAGYPVYKMIPDSYKYEISTIRDDSDTTRKARFEFWGYGLDMFLDNPVLGVGAGNYPWTVHEYQMKRPGYDSGAVTLHGGRSSHSLYFTLIPELGMAGIILFALILKNVFRRMRRVISLGNEFEGMSEYGLLAKAFIVSAVAYLVTGAFISVLYYPPFWYLIAFVVTLDRVANAELQLIDKKEEDATKGHSYYRDSRTRRRREDSRPGGRWSTQ